MEVLPEKAVRDEGEPCGEGRNLETVPFPAKPQSPGGRAAGESSVLGCVPADRKGNGSLPGTVTLGVKWLQECSQFSEKGCRWKPLGSNSKQIWRMGHWN